VILQQADYKHIIALGSEVLECGNISDLQDTAMRHLGELLPTQSMMFMNGEPPNWHPEEMHTHGFDSEFPYVFLELSYTDPGVPLVVQDWLLRKSQVLNSSLIMPAGVESDALVYQRVLKPRELRHTLAFSIAVGEDSYGILVLFRSERAGQYTPHEMAVAEAFMPFLKGALDRIQATEQKRRLTSLLDHVSQNLTYKALIILDHRMRLVCALPSQEKLIEDIIHDITSSQDQKSVLTPDLRPICQNLLSSPGKSQMNLTIGYTDPAGQYFQMPAEIRKQLINDKYGLSLRIGFADKQTDIKTRLDTCGLTIQERIIAEQLTCGLKNAEIAKNLAISPSTVANHVSSILAKAEIPSRSQLMSTPDTQQQLSALPVTNREKQILLSKFAGLSTKAIASRFNISQITVQNHLRIIYHKLGVSGFRGVVNYLKIKTQN
jgi:DNA-binding NarL/FixJ family response regulator